LLFAAWATSAIAQEKANAESKPTTKVLFLGDQGHHVPGQRFAQLEPFLKPYGIELTYTEDVGDLNPKKLAEYQALMLYANIDEISGDQATALLNYVNDGGGFVPLHCASFCFRNNDEVVKLIGAQFQKHGTGIFRTQLANTGHPVMNGFGGFESWDETYTHHLHNEQNRTVLEYRVEENHREPWTWVRTHGKGRVFYTAWGHDQRTFRNPGFINLVARGTLWAVGRDPAEAGEFHEDAAFPIPQMTTIPKDVAPFEYIDVGKEIPNYTAGEKWGTQAEPLNMMQKPLPAEESIKHYVTPVGFHVELFAAEPDIAKAIAMTWDERGRLWICETVDYPNELRAPGTGNDRVRICEDTDNDGRADKFTVFAEKLSIPTAITCYRGGVIVQDGTQTLYLKDTDGDDKADVRKVLIRGWALGDTHGGVSNFQYGLDNWIYAMQGYNSSEPVAEGKKFQRFANGFFRFKLDQKDPPSVTDIEFLRSTNNNTWGLGISEAGIIFGSTANHNPSVYMPLANRYYEQVRGWSPMGLGTIAESHLFSPITKKVRQVDHHGGYTAGAGHALYTARRYPREYWDRVAFVCGPTGHLIGSFVIDRDGADFHSKNSFNLLASDDEWAAPIMAEVGPDGNVWVIDWYNFIVQHNPTPAGFKTGKGAAYETKLRDKTHGRIYRVVYDGKEGETLPEATRSLDPKNTQQLIAALGDSNMFWRKTAQRLLVEQHQGDEAVIQQVASTFDDLAEKQPAQLNHGLWTLKGLGAFDGQENRDSSMAKTSGSYQHPDWSVRMNAPLATGRANPTGLQDRHALVRLATLRTVADTAESSDDKTDWGTLLKDQLNDPVVLADRWLLDALTSAAATHAEPFLIAVVSDTEHAVPAESTRVVLIVAEHYARAHADKKLAATFSVNRLLQASSKARPEVAAQILSGLEAGWPKDADVKLDDASQTALNDIFEKMPVASKGTLLQLARKWKVDSLDQHAASLSAGLLKRVQDTALADDQRIAAAGELATFNENNHEIAKKLLAQIAPQSSPEFAVAMLNAAAATATKETGESIVAIIPSLTPTGRERAVALLIQRQMFTDALLAAMDKGAIELSDLSLQQRQSLLASSDAKLAARAKEFMSSGGALPNPDRVKVIEELMAVTTAKGNAEKGKALFTKHCANCHAHSGEGAKIGPDLTGMAAHPKTEMLINILDPNRSVEGNFRVYNVETIDGLALTGLLASESKTAIELVQPDGKKISLLREDIEVLFRGENSLMPEGFEKTITAEELTDLLEFLAARGKFFPLDMAKAATIASDRGMFFEKEGDVERMIFPDWAPKEFRGVTFYLVDPQEGTKPNVILLNGPLGKIAPTMPKQVEMACGSPASAIHLLSGVSGWGFPVGQKGTVSMIVRLKYADGQTEDHPLKNGVHFADYISRQDVPESEFAFKLRNQQIRYLAIRPERDAVIDTVQFIKGDDQSAPIVMAVTVEGRE
jgi:putative membrane-bound dehydrogenase-like protein